MEITGASWLIRLDISEISGFEGGGGRRDREIVTATVGQTETEREEKQYKLIIKCIIIKSRGHASSKFTNALFSNEQYS